MIWHDCGGHQLPTMILLHCGDFADDDFGDWRSSEMSSAMR
jgi:hypothetical protein